MTPRLHPEFRDIIAAFNLNYDLDLDLLEAVALRESASKKFPQGNPCATRYEPGYWEKYYADEPEQELFSLYGTRHPKRLATSYGLFQVMFGTAYDMGFRGPPEKLIILQFNILYALKYLSSCKEIAIGENHPGYSIQFVMLCKYNGGLGAMPPFERQKNYAKWVLKKRDEIRKEREDANI